MDAGTILTNEELRRLDKRMDDIYKAAHETAMQKQQNAIKRLADFNASLPADITDEQRRTQAILKAKSKYAREMTDNIAAIYAEVGAKAVTQIRRTSDIAYSINLDFGRYTIDRQAGVFLPFETIDAKQLKIQLGLDGKPPFSKIQSIENYGRLDPKTGKVKHWKYIKDKDGTTWAVHPERIKENGDWVKNPKAGQKVRKSFYNRDKAFANLQNKDLIVQRLQNELTQAMLLGESRTQITARFREVAGMSHRQARMVAQTEITRIQSQTRHLSIMEAQELGVDMSKTWIARMVRTRDTHASLNNKTVPANEDWITTAGNPLAFPGDPDGEPEEIINCHCVMRPKVKNVPESIVHAREMAGMKVDQRISFDEWRRKRGG